MFWDAAVVPPPHPIHSVETYYVFEVIATLEEGLLLSTLKQGHKRKTVCQKKVKRLQTTADAIIRIVKKDAP